MTNAALRWTIDTDDISSTCPCGFENADPGEMIAHWLRAGAFKTGPRGNTPTPAKPHVDPRGEARSKAPRPLRPGNSQEPPGTPRKLPIPPREGWFAAMTLWCGTITLTGFSILLGPVVVRPVAYWIGDHWYMVHILVALTLVARYWPPAWARVQRAGYWTLYAAGLLGFTLSTLGFIAGAIMFVVRTS